MEQRRLLRAHPGSRRDQGVFFAPFARLSYAGLELERISSVRRAMVASSYCE